MHTVSDDCWAEIVAAPEDKMEEREARGVAGMINDILLHRSVARGQPFYLFTGMDAPQATRELLLRFCRVYDEGTLAKACHWVADNDIDRHQLQDIEAGFLREWGLKEGQVLRFKEASKQIGLDHELSLLPEHKLVEVWKYFVLGENTTEDSLPRH